ncbi:MAG: MIP/aquaporin family protein [Propionivibrio sp.]|jgi:glycerol uptake facilitator protein
MTPFVSEIVGTAMILLFGCGVVAGVLLDKSKAQGGGWIVITFAWAIGVTLGVYASGQFSGAHLNPAVSIALAAVGKFDWALVPTYVLGQFIGAMVGSGLVYLAYLSHWGGTSDPGLKLAVFSTGPAVRNPVGNFICEFISTAILLFVIMFLGANKYAEGVGPIAVGILILGMGLSFGGPTGYALNPARDLGPRIMHALLPIPGKGDSDWGYSWIPVVAPVLGGICGAALASAVL